MDSDGGCSNWCPVWLVADQMGIIDQQSDTHHPLYNSLYCSKLTNKFPNRSPDWDDDTLLLSMDSDKVLFDAPALLGGDIISLAKV